MYVQEPGTLAEIDHVQPRRAVGAKQCKCVLHAGQPHTVTKKFVIRVRVEVLVTAG